MFDDLQVIFLLLIFLDRCLNGGEVLLVAQIDMIQERALPRQESAGNLEGLGMPVLGFLLLIRCVESHVLFHLNYEADLS